MAGTSQTETMAFRTPFQKHSTGQDDASHQMRIRSESRIPKPSAPQVQTPKQPLAQGRIDCNYLFCVPLKISHYLLPFMAWCGPSHLCSSLLPPASGRPWSLEGWQVGAAWSNLSCHPSMPGTAREHRTDREQSEGAVPWDWWGWL